MQKIVFRNPDNTIGIITPTQEALDKYGINAVALKDVPHGLEYKIINTSDLPESRIFRDAWEWDTTTVPDGVGAVSNTFEGVAK